MAEESSYRLDVPAPCVMPRLNELSSAHFGAPRTISQQRKKETDMRKLDSYLRKYTPIMGAAEAEKFYRNLQRTAARASVVARQKKKWGL